MGIVTLLARSLAHALRFTCKTVRRDGVGTFVVHASRIGPRCYVSFMPDLRGAAFHPVPFARDGDGVMCLDRMLQSGSAFEAMAVLRRAERGEGFA